MTEHEEYIDGRHLSVLDELPIQKVPVMPAPGRNVVVVIIAAGEDEYAALEAVGLAAATWDDMMDRADTDSNAATLRATDDASILVEQHYTSTAQFRRVRQDVPTVAEWAAVRHEQAGGSGRANRAERREAARAARAAARHDRTTDDDDRA